MVRSSRVDCSSRLRIRNGRIPGALRAVFPRALSAVYLISALLLATGLSAQPANTILMERWDGITGTAVSNLTGNANYPNTPTTRTYPTLYETPTNTADNFGTRTRGYVTAPTTGNYIFWIAGDDNCELWLGTNDLPSTIRQIASVPEWTNSREWGKFAQQQSAVIALTAGARYYIETRHKEGTGGDNLAVGWQLPSGTQERPIPGSRLAPFLLPTTPAITTQPANLTVNPGQTATFSIVATGSAPLTYQWQRDAGNISGANSASYTTPAATLADNAAGFRCVVTNAVGNAISQAAILTVRNPPVITTQPINTTVPIGSQADFSVVASGGAPLSYQWIRGTSDIPGATAPTYTIPSTTAADNGAVFSCRVTNSFGTVTSSTALLTAIVFPSIVTNIQSQSAAVGQTVVFTVVAIGTGPLEYEFQKNGSTAYRGPLATYTTPPLIASDNNSQWRVIVRNLYGSNTGASVTLTVTGPPVINVQPAPQVVNEGQTATFSVVATGAAPLTYQWRRNGLNISGATLATYSTPAFLPDNGSQFSVVVANGSGPVISANALLTVNAVPVPPAIITNPLPQTVNQGQTANFSIFATGTAPLSYQWQKNSANITGATSASYTTPAATAADNGSLYRCIVINPGGTATSQAAILTVRIAPVITTQPVPQNVGLGQTASFSVVATGTAPLSYQWRKNGIAIGGATSASYTTPPATAADNGALFDVQVSNALTTVTSATALLTVGGTSASYPFTEDFESGAFGPHWTFYKSNPLGRAIVTNTDIPYAGAFHALLDVNTQGSYNLNEMILTVNLAGQTNVELGFYHKITGDEDEVLPASFTGHYNGDGVAVSVDGINWYKAVGTTVSEGGSYTYRLFRVNLDAVAAAAGIAFTSNFQIKFQQYDDYASPTDGHFFDNIRLGAPLPNQPPTVSITSPLNGSVYNTPATIYIYPNAVDPDGTVGRVEFYRGGTTLIGTSSVSPFTFAWTGAPIGAHSLTAKAFDNLNLAATSQAVNITVNEAAPFINAFATPASGGSPLNVTFTATNSGGTVATWLWNFGDGTNSAVQNPVHTFTGVGAYSVTVTATGPGGSSNYNLMINVIAPPNITITATPISGTRPLNVSFSAANTGGPIASYAWTFGNGGVSSSSNPIYTYTAAGTFTATLTATNAGGASTASRIITVNPIQYNLTTCVTGNGSTTPPVGTLPVAEGQILPIVASPSAGHQFEAWRVVSGSVVIANPALASTTLTLTSNASVCADFHPDPVTLTLVHTGNGSTTPIATASVIPGRNFNIGAVPAAGYKFIGWTVPSGDAVIANPSLPATRLILTSASTVQAEFIPEAVVPANKKLAISGELADVDGNRVGYPNPVITDISVRLWTALTGGTAVYSETFLAANAQGVSVDDGFFVARLGEGATAGNLQQVVNAHPQLWVEITIEGATPDVLSPRTPLTASAYALGGVPTLVPAVSAVMHGTGDPNAIKANAAIGSYFVNDDDDSTWLKISSGWSRIH